jgi:hypothetical protein
VNERVDFGDVHHESQPRLKGAHPAEHRRPMPEVGSIENQGQELDLPFQSARSAASPLLGFLHIMLRWPAASLDSAAPTLNNGTFDVASHGVDSKAKRKTLPSMELYEAKTC